jgi:hypothetical protein
MRRRGMDRRSDRIPGGAAKLPPHVDSCKLRIAMSRLSHYNGGLSPIVEMPEEKAFEKEDSFYFVKKFTAGESLMLTEFIDDHWSSDDESGPDESSDSEIGDCKSDCEPTDVSEEGELTPIRIDSLRIEGDSYARTVVDEDARVSILRLRAAFRKAWIDVDSCSDTESREGDSNNSSRASTPTLPSDNTSPVPIVCCPMAVGYRETIDSDTENRLQRYWAGRLDESKPKADEWMPSHTRVSFGSFRPLPPTNSIESPSIDDEPSPREPSPRRNRR